MSEPSFCYWSVATGYYGRLMTSCIASARRVGVVEPFHVWTDTPVAGATCHRITLFEHRNFLFKFDYLLKAIELPYDYFVFLDADSIFVRHPGSVLNQLNGAPVHVALECDCTRPSNDRTDWWGCPLNEYVRLMRVCGVRSSSIFNTNAGFWIVHRDAARRFVELAMEFWTFSANAGFQFTEEPPLAYAGHMLMGNPYAHVVETNADIWATDWRGVFADRLPDGMPWLFTDYMDGHQVLVNPAIVHCMHSKSAMSATTSPMRKPWTLA